MIKGRSDAGGVAKCPAPAAEVQPWQRFFGDLSWRPNGNPLADVCLLSLRASEQRWLNLKVWKSFEAASWMIHKCAEASVTQELVLLLQQAANIHPEGKHTSSLAGNPFSENLFKLDFCASAGLLGASR